MPSWSQKIEVGDFPADFCTRKILGWGDPLCRHSIDCALSPGHSDLTRFRPWSPIATGKYLDHDEKIPNFLKLLAPLTFLVHVQAFRDSLRGEIPHIQIFMNYGPNPLTWDAQLPSYWFSRNPAVFQDLLMNLINNIRGGHGFGSFRTRRNTGGKIATSKLCHPLFDGGIRWYIFPKLFCQSCEFPSEISFAGGKISWWQLASRCCWNRARLLTYFLSASVKRKDSQFGTWTDPSFQEYCRFRPRTLGSMSV